VPWSGRPAVRRACAAVALALAALAVPTSASAATPPPFVPVALDHIAVPEGVQPWLPNWTADGRRIVFRDQVRGTLWTATRDGEVTCVSCRFAGGPTITGGFTYAFPDGRRLFMSTKELGATGGGDDPAHPDAWVLECAPSIARCATHRYLPVDLSADQGGSFIIQRRTWHLAPDGVHLGWMDLRLDGTAMVVAKLVRKSDRYVASDPRVVNPSGPTGATDLDVGRWTDDLQLYELKAFADGGRSILAVAEPSYNTDVLKIDLKTGRTTRLTAGPDWDEDGAISPDDRSYALYSWRTRDRATAAAWLPQLRALQAMPFGGALAPFYVSTWQGFQCDLSPWLLPASGDAGGTLVGQPLNVYGGNYTAANNLSGQQFWSPDSTSILLQERLRTKPPASANADVAQKGLVPSRLTIARLDQAPTTPRRIVSSAVGAWAPAASAWHGVLASNRTVTLAGRAGGTVTLSLSGDLSTTRSTAVYAGYTDDGRTFVDGTMTITGASPWHIAAAIRVSGAHTGTLDADLTVDNSTSAAHPLPTKTGSFTATYDGRTAPALPALGSCYDALPRRTPLRASATRTAGGRRVRVTVTADIAGDRRPVRNATVRIGTRHARTDARGRATLTTPGRAIRVSAGDTFTAVSIHG
jgi:hypothetical protein